MIPERMGSVIRVVLRAISAAAAFVLFGYALLACTGSFMSAGFAADRDVGAAFLLGFGSFAIAFILAYYALAGRLPGRR